MSHREPGPPHASPGTLLSALAARGVSAQATILTMRATGRTQPGRAPDEYEFDVAFTTDDGQAIRVTVRQYMLPEALDGLAGGAPATIMYDRTDPTALVVRRSPSAKGAGPATVEEFSASTD